MHNLDLENLNSISSGVNLSQVLPIHQKRLLTFVNHFIITTVSFLNNFAQTCERKLLYCDEKMQKLEAELCILEAKLNSIPGLDDIRDKVLAVEEATSKIDSHPEDVACPPPADSTDQGPSTSQGEVSENITPPASRDPELARFFKMVQFGVPPQAVKLKMQQEGFDPNLLDV